MSEMWWMFRIVAKLCFFAFAIGVVIGAIRWSMS